MNLLLFFFIVVAVLLLGLLLWAIRPARVQLKTPDEVFEALSAPRHYYRLPQILQALDPKDTEHLLERGFPALCHRLRAERRLVALRFLDRLEADYKTLLAASRMLAAMAPDVVGAEEWQRFRLNVRFALNCLALRIKLRVGLSPWGGFARLSDMASQMSYRLELVTSRISERAALSLEFPSLPDEGNRQS
jgi:hypothetical protein